MELKHTTISCPHCGHSMHLELDYSNGDQDYFEDCPNCGDTVHLNMHLDEVQHKLDVSVMSDDEQVY